MSKGGLRPYAKFSPTYWTGPTGKKVKARGRDAQVLACYLFTCPSSTMMGLYYLPLPTLCHEAGFTVDEARATLAILEDLEFAYYDEEAELVWVVEAARYQIDEELKPEDKRRTGIMRELESFAGHPYAEAFHARYGEAFSLPVITVKKSLPRPFSTSAKAVKTLPSKKKEKKQEQEQEKKQERTAPADAAAQGKPPAVDASPAKSWSAEACDDWAAHLGQPPGDRIGRALKPLLAKHDGWAAVRPVWQWACERAAASDNPDRFTPEVFARSYIAFLKRYRGELAGAPARASPSPRAQARHDQANAMIQGGLIGAEHGVDRRNGATGSEPTGPGADARDVGPPRPQLPRGSRPPDG